MSQINFFVCLRPLLEALNWQGDRRAIFESAPHLQPHLNFIELRNLMANLGFQSKRIEPKLISRAALPCLAISKERVILVNRIADTMAEGIDFTNNTPFQINHRNIPGKIYTFGKPTPDLLSIFNWFWKLQVRFKNYFWPLAFYSILSGFLTFATTAFMLVVYDWVIPSYSKQSLQYMIYGVGLGLFVYYIAHHSASTLLSRWSARQDILLQTQIMSQILHLPPHYVEGNSVNSQIYRLKQYDNVREIFNGPLAQLLFDMPVFIIISLGLCFLVGLIALIPLILAGLLFGLILIFMPLIRAAMHNISQANLAKHNFLIEMFTHLEEIKWLGGEKTWLRRFKRLLPSVTAAQRDVEGLNNAAQVIASTLLRLAGVIAILWATVEVMNQHLSASVLVGVIILIWRALSPIQNLFLILPRLDQILDSVHQINVVMSTAQENRHIGLLYPLKGALRVEGVSLRYPQETFPALQGISMMAEPGEMIAIVGNNAGGKSSLFRVLLGVYSPQVGLISYDGVDMRSFNMINLRQSIAYSPQKAEFFHGTIGQNLRLAMPDASLEEMEAACQEAGILENILSLPMQFDTLLDDQKAGCLTSGFRQKLNLARAYLRKSNLMLLDEPTGFLDANGEEAVKSMLRSRHGKQTIILSTQRPSIINMADRVLVLKSGRLQVFGPRDKVIAYLMEQRS